jgi:uncharacterized protein YbbK (DUF523 family)
VTPILVSACLLGRPVRYGGSDKLADSAILRRWLAEGRVVSVCPELAGDGVTAALLRAAGIAVFSEAQFAAADALLAELDARPAPER